MQNPVGPSGIHRTCTPARPISLGFQSSELSCITIILKDSLKGGWSQGRVRFFSQVTSNRISKKLSPSSYTRGGLCWILGKKNLSLKEWSGLGTGCPGQGWSDHPGSVQEVNEWDIWGHGLEVNTVVLG